MDNVKSLLVVIVLYNISLEESESLKSLNENGIYVDVLIYDNSFESRLNNPSVFKYLNITYIHDSSNPGVSKAYNYAFNKAIKNNYDWLILLDQDTILPNDGLVLYIKSINDFKDVLIHAPILKGGDKIFSPSRYKFRRGFMLKTVMPGLNNLKKIVPLNSGLCIHISVLEMVNGYNEKIRLDFSDFDFIRRVAMKIEKFVVIPLIAAHSLSTEHETFQSSIARYKFYCNGARQSLITFFDFFILGIVVILRGAKLTTKFRSIMFLIIFINYYLLKKELP